MGDSTDKRGGTMAASQYLICVLFAIVVIAFLLVPVELGWDYIEKRRQYKAQRKDIELNIRVWESIAKSCDSITEAYDKGYAIARLVLYHHELEELENNRKRDLCS